MVLYVSDGYLLNIFDCFLVPALSSRGLIDNILPLHQKGAIKHLQQSWVLTLFEEQPLSLISEYFGTEIAMYFAWLGYMTTALWFPAIIGISFHRNLPLTNRAGKFLFYPHVLSSVMCFWSFTTKKQHAELWTDAVLRFCSQYCVLALLSKAFLHYFSSSRYRFQECWYFSSVDSDTAPQKMEKNNQRLRNVWGLREIILITLLGY